MSADLPRVYLLDVEGTTSPVSLVSEQLFPYARKHLAAFLREHWNEPETRADLALLAEESRAEKDEQWVLRFAQDDKFCGWVRLGFCWCVGLVRRGSGRSRRGLWCG
jgi:enolase-phosphatase E1